MRGYKILNTHCTNFFTQSCTEPNSKEIKSIPAISHKMPKSGNEH